jgi:transcriptional regulator with XRE-family HTH domain
MEKSQQPRAKPAQAPQSDPGREVHDDVRTVVLDGSRLRTHRKNRGWSQQVLADRSGVSEDTVSRAENGRPLRVGIASVIASEFGVPLPTLLSSVPEPLGTATNSPVQVGGGSEAIGSSENTQLLHPPSVPVLESIHGQLRRESNPRFGFSFVHPSIWDREDPANGDGNTYRHPQDSRIELRAWGGYAVVSPDLRSWVDWTIESLQREDGFYLLARVPSGRRLIDWEDGGQITSYRQVEGCRIVYNIEEDGQPFTTTQTFLQFDDTQGGLSCRAPSASYERYEELFLVISKELRILGESSAPFALGVDRGSST